MEIKVTSDQSLLKKIGCWLRAFGQVLMLCRFSVLSVMVAGAFLLFMPQGQEVLFKLASAGLLSQVFFLLAAFSWALSIWYWPRVFLSFRFAGWPPTSVEEGDSQPAMTRWFTRVVPRSMGIAALLIVAGALFKTVTLAQSGEQEYMVLNVLGIIFMIAALIFGIFVSFRRDLFKRHFAEQQVWGFNSDGISYTTVKDLWKTKPTFFILSISAGVSFAFFILFTIRTSNLTLAPYLGSATILLAATAAWIPAGFMLMYVGQRFRFPTLSMMTLYLLLVSSFNDNHHIATLVKPNTISQETTHDLNVKSHFEKWVDQACKGGQATKDCPVYIVAAEGGGIRAAYWTASVLGHLQDIDPVFSSHLYVMSGVSGGSLGAAVFDALVATDLGKHDCKDTSSDKPTFSRSYERCSQSILSSDFLSPTFATMLYPDLVQRFLFWPVDYFDRGRTLEETWEGAWDQVMTSVMNKESVGFRQSFDQLWLDPVRQFQVPSLILNSTQVETGRRVLFSSLPINSGEFTDVVDLRHKMNALLPDNGKVNLALSTAVHGSARFTYISPAGKVEDGFHIVDGGYFENSGSSTALETLNVITQYKDTHHDKKIVPIIIHISNDPTLENIYTATCITEASRFGTDSGKRIMFGSETLSPVVTLFNTRDARAVYATEALASSVIANGGKFYHFGLSEDKKGQLPLGWSLSESATATMRKQVEKVNLGKCS